MDKKKILLIDDEKNFTQVVKLNLEHTGEYNVSALSDAKDILTYIHTFKPDIILLDLIMPNIGGLEVCEILNSDSLGKTIPIIILSALEKDIDKLHAYKLGVVGYLVKPVETIDIITAIRKVLMYKNITT